MSLEKEYEVLAEKYSLPSFDDFNKEFDVYCVDDDSFILREFVKKIVDKLDYFLKVLEGLLRPDLNVVDLHESNEFDDLGREKIWQLYKRLMFYNRFSYELDLVCSDEKFAFFIKDFWAEWVLLKKDLFDIVVKIKGSWLKDIELEFERGYVG